MSWHQRTILTIIDSTVAASGEPRKVPALTSGIFLVISCTKLIIEAELVDVILWVDDLRSILKLVLKAGGDAAKKARSVIQTLGIRGHLEYRDLLA